MHTWNVSKDRDLWQGFQEAIKAKNPFSEAVAEGRVNKEDKARNDWADEAAEKKVQEKSNVGSQPRPLCIAYGTVLIRILLGRYKAF